MPGNLPALMRTTALTMVLTVLLAGLVASPTGASLHATPNQIPTDDSHYAQTRLCNMSGIHCEDWADPTQWVVLKYATDDTGHFSTDCRPPFVACVAAASFVLRTCIEIDETIATPIPFWDITLHKIICIGAAVSGSATHTVGFGAASAADAYAGFSDVHDSESLSPLDPECVNEFLLESKTACKVSAAVGSLTWTEGDAPDECFEASATAMATLHGVFTGATGGVARSSECELTDHSKRILDLGSPQAQSDQSDVQSSIEFVDLPTRLGFDVDHSDFIDLLEAEISIDLVDVIHAAIFREISADLSHLYPDLTGAPQPVIDLIEALEHDLEQSVRSIEIEEIRIYAKQEASKNNELQKEE